MRIRSIRMLAVLLVAAAVTGTALAATHRSRATVRSAHNTMYGSLLVTPGGLTLYHLTSEKRGRIACTGKCTSFWPPLVVGRKAKLHGGTGVSVSKLGRIRRPDGRMQLTYAGKALYRFSGDEKPGDVNGEGVKDVGTWYAVRPSGALAKAPLAAPPAPPTTGTTTGGGYGGGYGG